MIYILADTDKTDERTSRVARMCVLFAHLQLPVTVFGPELCDLDRAENLQTQVGVFNGMHVEFTDQVLKQLNSKVRKGDFIIATEAWHQLCFRGSLTPDDGRFLQAPVIEMWIDYKDSFATYRMFASRFALAYAIAQQAQRVRHGMPEFNEHWLYSKPYIEAKLSPEANVSVSNYDRRNPFNVEHLVRNGVGIPASAPDYGTYAETIVHGFNGVLYRSEQGRAKALKTACELPSAPIVQWIQEQYNLEQAAAYFSYMMRMTNG